MYKISNIERQGGIILAGGASRRMGWDKALLCHNGNSMLERAVHTLQAVAGRIVIVAASADQYVVPGAETTPDLYPGAGPVGGILTGMLALGPGCHAVLACDMPMALTAVLELLLALAQQEQECDAVVPKVAGELEPLCAVYRDTAAEKLEEFMESGRRSARVALGCLNVRIVEEAELRLLDPELITFTNVNTPEDLAALDASDTERTPSPNLSIQVRRTGVPNT